MVTIATAICCEKNEECIISETCQDGACGNAKITIFNRTGTVYIPTQDMKMVTKFTYTLNLTKQITKFGVYPYVINSSTNKTCEGDCQIEVKRSCEGKGQDEFNLYIVAIVMFIIFISLGYYFEESTLVIIAGFLSMVIAVNLYINGFPHLESEFLKDAMVIIFAGIGFYFTLIPSINYFENFPGSFGGKLE